MTTPTLIEAARAVVARWDSPDWSDAAHTRDYIDALRAAIEAAEKAEPAAYRVEVRWRNRRLDQTWRKYSDCVSRCAAGTVRGRVVNSDDMESRIVPLYAGTPEESR